MSETKSINITIRVTPEQKEQIVGNQLKNGFESLSAYLKFVAMNCKVEATAEKD